MPLDRPPTEPSTSGWISGVIEPGHVDSIQYGRRFIMPQSHLRSSAYSLRQLLEPSNSHVFWVWLLGSTYCLNTLAPRIILVKWKLMAMWHKTDARRASIKKVFSFSPIRCRDSVMHYPLFAMCCQHLLFGFIFHTPAAMPAKAARQQCVDVREGRNWRRIRGVGLYERAKGGGSRRRHDEHQQQQELNHNGQQIL